MTGQAQRDLTAFHDRRIELEEKLKDLSSKSQAERSAKEVSLVQTLEQLTTAVEELTTAEEELRAQNDELIALQDECERERQRYQALFHLCPDAYVVTDEAGSITEANDAAASLLHRADLEGKPIANFTAPGERPHFRQRLVELTHAGRIDHWQVNIRPDVDDLRPVVITAECGDRPDRGEREIRWLIRDLTEQKRNEEQMQRLQDQVVRSEHMTAIGTLAAGLGHDVKNLLFPLRCRLESLETQQLPDETSQDIQGIRHAVQYLQQLANNLQLMAEKPDPTRMIVGVTDVPAWWDHVMPLMDTALPTHAQLSYNFEEGLPPVAIAPHQLTQAVMNLVNNAGDVISEGGSVIVWAQRAKHGPFVKLGVSDDGPGMPPEVLRRALDPFFTTKPRTTGLSTGMGLSIVRGIVKSVGGSVRIDSTPGEGTTVILRVPLAAEPQRPHVERPANLPHAAVSIGDPHLASTMCTLLNLSRLPAWQTDAQDPGESMLWIAEPTNVPTELAQQYIQQNPKRKLVLFGSKSEQWEHVPAIWIEHTAGLKDIRDTLSEVAFEVLRNSS